MNGGTRTASWRLRGRMEREEIGYSIKPEQFANGITRKKVTQTGCVHKRKNNGLMRQIEENYKKNESR